MFSDWWSVMERGGLVMWPLLGLSLVSVTLVVERWWFLASVGRASAWRAARGVAADWRRSGDVSAGGGLREAGPVWGGFLREVRAGLDSGVGRGLSGDALLTEAAEHHRGKLERFLPTLSTIVTAAPMLGILGTVLGIIESFELLGGGGMEGVEPRAVGAGIAEALISTAAGLVVALLTLFPYVALRGKAAALLGRLEALAGSVREVTDAAASRGVEGRVVS